MRLKKEMQHHAWYNEIDPYAAAWLRNLISAGLIPAGDVDERSIVDVRPDDLDGYTQCHFFAGIGGWSRALRLAGWHDDRPAWTGSCPCQPFSVAGKQAGFSDERHLWPQFRRLIAERRPATVFGEQVAGASDWLRLVRGDLEAMDYAVGAIPMEAASADADHLRDRYWFVADNDIERASQEWEQRGGELGGPGSAAKDTSGAMANGYNTERRPKEPARHDAGGQAAEWHQGNGYAAKCGSGLVEHFASLGWGEGWTEHEFRSRGFTAAVASIDGGQYLECPDGKWRRLPPPRVRWLGHGIPARVAKLRAFGNSIDPRPASQFIAAYMERPNAA